jgi:hypothetical protein
LAAEVWARILESFMHGSRSTVLKSLLYLDAITLIGTVSSPVAHAATWLQVVIAVAFCLSFVSTLLAYGYFMFKDPDALRSEKFGIDKLTIEKGLVGDNNSGLARAPVSEPLIPGHEPPRLEHDSSEGSR